MFGVRAIRSKCIVRPQGGAAVDALLQQGQYAVRGLTRNKDSDKAKKLAAKGVEMVQGDMSDKNSLVEVSCQTVSTKHE